MAPAPGSPAPSFSLPDQDGSMHPLAGYKGKWVVLYFYPKDFTPGCTAEACGFRDAFNAYRGQGMEVLGVSRDSVLIPITFQSITKGCMNCDRAFMAFPYLLSPRTRGEDG